MLNKTEFCTCVIIKQYGIRYIFNFQISKLEPMRAFAIYLTFTFKNWISLVKCKGNSCGIAL